MATRRARVRMRLPDNVGGPTDSEVAPPNGGLLPGEREIKHGYSGVTIHALATKYRLFEHVTIKTPVTTVRTTVEGKLVDYDPRLPMLLRGLVGISPMQRKHNKRTGPQNGGRR